MPILGTIASSRRAAGGPADFAIAHDVSPYVTVWPFSSATGYGTKYANPAVLPASTGHGVDFATTNATIGVAGYQYASAWAWSSSGFGTKKTDPAATTLYFDSLAIAKDNSFAALTNYTTTPGVNGYAFSASSGFGSKFSNPGTLPGPNAEMYGVDINNASTDTVFAGYDSPYLLAYPMSSSGFGTKYANPSPLPEPNNGSPKFSPTDLAVASNSRDNSPYIRAWAWTNGSGFGTVYSAPSTSINAWVMSLDFHPTGAAIGMGLQAGYSPYVAAYAWSDSSGWGTKYSNPSTLPASQSMNGVFNPAGDVFALAMSSGSYTIAYAWSNGTGFGAKYSDPATAPTGYPLYANFSR
jgi:hypothetical protein